MGDSEAVPGINSQTHGRSSSANNYTFNNIGRTSVILLSMGIGMAIGISVGSSFMFSRDMAIQERNLNERIQAAERRAMDMAGLAEREARIAQDKYTYIQGELAKKGIHISTDGH